MKPWAIKRFLELHRGEPEFRSELDQDPEAAVRRWGLEVDPERLRPLLDTDAQNPAGGAIDPEVERYREVVAERVRQVRRLIASAGGCNPVYRSWRERQMARLATQTPLEHSELIGHAAFAVELARGCSVQCSYCGLAAPPLTGVARFTAANELLFRSILTTLGEFFGEGVDTGFLYWATEPFDNPDYERYLQVFCELCGCTPQTTTAAWHRDIERTRRLLELSGSNQGRGDRLSINSLQQLHQCMGEFSAQELENVFLVQQHPEASPLYCSSGRGAEINPESPVGSNACLTGFLINLVERSVELVSPCNDPDRWPLGYAVYRRGHFETAAELADFMRSCEREIMHETFDDDLVLRLRDDLQVERDDTGTVSLVTSSSRMDIEDPCELSTLESLDGGKPVGKVVDELMGAHGAALVYHRLRRLRRCGLFEHLPEPAGRGGREQDVPPSLQHVILS